MTPEREREILATLDPIAAMARADETRLNELLTELQVDGLSAESGDALGDLLAALPELVPLEQDEDPGDQGGDADGSGGGEGGGDYEPSAKILLTLQQLDPPGDADRRDRPPLRRRERSPSRDPRCLRRRGQQGLERVNQIR